MTFRISRRRFGAMAGAAAASAILPGSARAQAKTLTALGHRVHQTAATTGPGGDTVERNGEAVPFAQLGSILGHARGRDATPRAVVHLRGEAGRVALGVEHLLRSEVLVLRPMPSVAAVPPIVTGVSVDPAGDLRLVLDPARVARAISTAKAPQASETRPRLPILVVDDSLTTRMLEHSILDAAGFEVGLASSAEEALTILAERSYDLVLVDIEMPGIDGFTFVERLRADPDLARLPAILVTSLSSAEDQERGRRVGADGYVVKGDFDQDRLLRQIRSLLAG